MTEVGPDQVRVRLDDGSIAMMPRGVIAVEADKGIKVGMRLSVRIRKSSPEATEEWEVKVLSPSRYSQQRGEDPNLREVVFPSKRPRDD